MKKIIVERILTGWLVTPINQNGIPEIRRHFDRIEDVLDIVKNHFDK